MTHQRTTYRFDGTQASLSNICKKVNREVRGNRLCRLELRVSSQSVHPIPLGQARSSLLALLRERGLNSVAVSVRPFDLPLDDGMGEHQLVLIETPKPPSWWSRVQVWLKRRLGGLPTTATPERIEPRSTQPQTQPSAPPQGPSPREVSRVIKRACLASLRDMPVDELGLWMVHHIDVRIRSASLCQAASPLLPPVASVFVQWMAREAQRSDLQAAPTATLTVLQLPDLGSDESGTVLVSEGDVSIELRAVPIAPFAPAGTLTP